MRLAKNYLFSYPDPIYEELIDLELISTLSIKPTQTSITGIIDILKDLSAIYNYFMGNLIKTNNSSKLEVIAKKVAQKLAIDEKNTNNVNQLANLVSVGYTIIYMINFNVFSIRLYLKLCLRQITDELLNKLFREGANRDNPAKEEELADKLEEFIKFNSRTLIDNLKTESKTFINASNYLKNLSPSQKASSNSQNATSNQNTSNKVNKNNSSNNNTNGKDVAVILEESVKEDSDITDNCKTVKSSSTYNELFFNLPFSPEIISKKSHLDSSQSLEKILENNFNIVNAVSKLNLHRSKLNEKVLIGFLNNIALVIKDNNGFFKENTAEEVLIPDDELEDDISYFEIEKSSEIIKAPISSIVSPNLEKKLKDKSLMVRRPTGKIIKKQKLTILLDESASMQNVYKIITSKLIIKNRIQEVIKGNIEIDFYTYESSLNTYFRCYNEHEAKLLDSFINNLSYCMGLTNVGNVLYKAIDQNLKSEHSKDNELLIITDGQDRIGPSAEFLFDLPKPIKINLVLLTTSGNIPSNIIRDACNNRKVKELFSINNTSLNNNLNWIINNIFRNNILNIDKVSPKVKSILLNTARFIIKKELPKSDIAYEAVDIGNTVIVLSDLDKLHLSNNTTDLVTVLLITSLVSIYNILLTVIITHGTFILFSL